MHAPEAQDEPEAKDSLHHVTTSRSGAQIPPKAVPLDSRACRVLRLAQPHRNSGQDLVPEQEGQGQAPPGGRTRETQDGGQTYVRAWTRYAHSCQRVLLVTQPAPRGAQATDLP